ncbi:uncharacterized protein SAPINGB_P002904 [Magnusiomyces paraingens]|uniref:Uncharacterized protein n=1 Tax=Magnusiomyces paraingens TaxID=2606893 RepID=A0A5E8BH25_9ASCO|nr:uncharacterized protein SAPINGB_P002904 [Saprochaete ingens]VVT50860.1 unnamed protein product [Saprochaete ingens]
MKRVFKAFKKSKYKNKTPTNFIDPLLVISFGVRYWQMGYIDSNGTTKEIEINSKEKRMLSCIYYNGHRYIFGNEAQLQSQKNNQSAIFEIHRLLGCTGSESESESYLKEYSVKRSKQVTYLGFKIDAGNGEEVYPTYLVAEFLKEMIRIATNQQDRKWNKIAIIIPAHFGTFQKEDILTAISSAGLEKEIPKERIFSDVSAYVYNYYLDNIILTAQTENVLFINISSSLTTLSLVEISKTKASVINEFYDSVFCENMISELIFYNFLKDYCGLENSIRFEKKQLRNLHSNKFGNNNVKALEQEIQSLISNDKDNGFLADIPNEVNISINYYINCIKPLLKYLSSIAKEACQKSATNISEIIIMGEVTKHERFLNTFTSFFNPSGNVSNVNISSTSTPIFPILYGVNEATLPSEKRKTKSLKFSRNDNYNLDLDSEYIFEKYSNEIPVIRKDMGIYVVVSKKGTVQRIMSETSNQSSLETLEVKGHSSKNSYFRESEVAGAGKAKD